MKTSCWSTIAFNSSLLSALPLIVAEGPYANNDLCLQVVEAVNSRISTHDGLWSILYYINRLLECELNWKVAYTPREQNRGADLLANYACIYL